MTYERIDSTLAEGTSGQLEVKTSYKKLVELFGEPDGSEDDKVSSEWVLRSSEGDVVTIYDWKATNLYSKDNPSVKQFRARKGYDWHIGAKNKEAAEELKSFIISQ